MKIKVKREKIPAINKELGYYGELGCSAAAIWLVVAKKRYYLSEGDVIHLENGHIEIIKTINC